MIGYILWWALVLSGGLAIYLAVMVATAPPRERGPDDRPDR